LSHRRDEDDDDTEINLSPQESYRRWGVAAAASGTAIAETAADRGLELVIDAPWLAVIVGDMQNGITVNAAGRFGFLGKLLVDFKKKGVKSCIGKEGMAHLENLLN
jgi:hypothetical protein